MSILTLPNPFSLEINCLNQVMIINVFAPEGRIYNLPINGYSDCTRILLYTRNDHRPSFAQQLLSYGSKCGYIVKARSCIKIISDVY